MREAILGRDQVEAIIGMGPNLFYGTGLAPCIWIVRDRKPDRSKGKVAFIDASTLFKRGRNQNTLEPMHIDQILSWYRAFEDVPSKVQVVGLSEIKEYGWNLNISLYVQSESSDSGPTVAQAVATVDERLREVERADENVRRYLRDWKLLE